MPAAPPWPDPDLTLAMVAALIIGVALITAVVRAGRTQAVHRDEWQPPRRTTPHPAAPTRGHTR